MILQDVVPHRLPRKAAAAAVVAALAIVPGWAAPKPAGEHEGTRLAELQNVILGGVRIKVADLSDQTGIDFSKLPLPPMQPSPVVRAALRGLGRKPLVIPGPLNKASGFAGKYLTPRRAQTALFGTLVSRALDKKPRRG